MKKTNRYKIRAFTVLELVVVMLLTSFAVGIFYTGFELISGQHHQFKSTQAGALETARLDHAIGYSWGEAHTVLRINSHELKFEIQGQKDVNYDFRHNMVIRRAENVLDTFNVSIGTLEFMFNEEEQGGLAALVDYVVVNVNPEKGDHVLVYTRHYGNARLIEIEKKM